MSATSRRRYRVFWPLTLVFVGIGLLLAQTGWLGPAALWRLGATWPVFLIIAGISLILRRYMAPAATALVVTATFVILGSGAVAYAVAGPEPGSATSVSASAPRGSYSAASLEVDASAVTLDIRVGDTTGNLFEAHVTGRSEANPNITFDQRAAKVTINADRWDWWPFASSRPMNVSVTLSLGVRWAVAVNGAAVNGQLDMQDGARNVQVNAAAGDVVMTLAAPQGSVPIELDGAAVNAEISVPSGVPVRVTTSGVAASITVDGRNSSGVGERTWSDAGFSAAPDRYDITANGASAQVSLTHLTS